jgi:TolB-like protein/Tfp pilus assembly protein PilF
VKAVRWFLSEIRRRKVAQTFVPYLGLVWLILQVVAVVTPMLNLPPLVATFIAVVLFALFPVMLYLSWYYDITVNGLVAVDRAENATDSRHSLVWWLVLFSITLCSAWVGYRYFSDIRSEFNKQQDGLHVKPGANSIAVLPFRDQSPNADQQYLATGIAEELTALLGQVQGLDVASASAGQTLSAQQLLPVDIAKRLNVDTILTGSIHSVGNMLKLRTELIDAKTNLTLWSQSFSRKMADIYQVEADIGRSIANLLLDSYMEQGSLQLSGQTRSADAYVIYLKGRELYRQQTSESIKQARQYFEQAVALDPEFAQGYVAIADTLVLLAEGDIGFGVIKADVAAELAAQQLDKALVRAPQLAEAHAVRGLALYHLQHQIDDALAAFDKAINLNPCLASAHLWRFVLLQQLGRQDDAWQALQLAYQFDPVSVLVQYNRGIVLANNGEYAKAKQQFNQLIADMPQSPLGYVGLADAAYQQGQLASSIENWHKAYQLSPDNPNYQQSFIGSLLELGLSDAVRQLTQDEYYQATLLLIDGRYDELFNKMNFALQAYPDDGWVQFEAAWYQLLVGDKATGIALLLTARQQLSTGDLHAIPLCSPAIEIAWALQLQQDPAATTLLQSCQPFLEVKQDGKPNIYQYYLRARLAAIRGDNQLAATELATAITNGWSQWWTAKDPLLADVVLLPQAKSKLQQLSQRLAAQRQQAKIYLSQHLPATTPTQ